VAFDPTAIAPHLLYTFREAALLAGLSRRTIEGWRARGLFAAAGGRRGGRDRRYISGADLLRLAAGGSPPAPPVKGVTPSQRRRESQRTQGVATDPRGSTTARAVVGAGRKGAPRPSEPHGPLAGEP
jgi:hypothetical protein